MKATRINNAPEYRAGSGKAPKPKAPPKPKMKPKAMPKPSKSGGQKYSW